MTRRQHTAFAVFLFVLAVATAFGLITPEHAMAFGLLGITTTEPNITSDWLKWEEDQRASRDDIVVASGQNLSSGHVIGKTVTGTATATAFAANTGNGVMGAITVSGDAKPGTYKLIFVEPNTNLGTFELEDPDGKICGRGNVGSAVSIQGLAFTLADGATDFVSGDGFDIKVVITGVKWKEHDPAATDGTERPAGILLQACDASATGTNADTNAVAITRQALIGDGSLTWKTGMTAQQKLDALAVLAQAGIIARKSV